MGEAVHEQRRAYLLLLIVRGKRIALKVPFIALCSSTHEISSIRHLHRFN
jgi:hypothetical protein